MRETGDFDRSEAPEEAFCEERLGLCMLKGGVPISGAVAGRPFVSKGGCKQSNRALRNEAASGSYLLLRDLSGRFYTVATLDHVCL